MKQSKRLIMIVLAPILLVAGMCLMAVVLISVLLIAWWPEAPYLNPPATFQETDLAGTWEANYLGLGTDKLIFKADGTFEQIYRDQTVEYYVYRVQGSGWWVERFSDGRVRVHLPGARYYNDGIETAELDGRQIPCPERQPNCWGDQGPPPDPFYDPIAGESLEMVGELVLNVRVDSSGELLLLHMWSSPDGGFAIIGGESEVFRRVKTP